MQNLPSPIDILMDPVSMIIIAIYLTLYLWENIVPRNKNMPRIRYATLRGVVAFFIFFFLSSYLPFYTDEFLASFQLIDLSAHAVVIQVLVGLLFYQLALYGWHRLMHNSNRLWRVFHQMHHSSERLDVPSTYYFSLMDMGGFTILGSLCFAYTIGLSPQSITVIILALNFLSIFQHANIKTPYWFGYFIQRPEQHSVHHQRGVHKYNYSDFPIYDLIFGTFKNPQNFTGETGFYDGASARVADMLSFKDVSNNK